MSLDWDGDQLDSFTGVIGEHNSKSQSQLLGGSGNHQAPLSIMGGFLGSGGLKGRRDFRDQFRLPIVTQQGVEHASVSDVLPVPGDADGGLAFRPGVEICAMMAQLNLVALDIDLLAQTKASSPACT